MATTKDIGNRGEDIASVYLQTQGFELIERNWKTRWCEIDIVAIKHGVVYFIEVKYRKSSTFGDAISYVTQAKLKQMYFAAEFWQHRYGYTGDCLLAVVAIDDNGKSVELIEVA